jgi:hypothetical protein
VSASYNHATSGSVTISITSSIPFASAPIVAVKPHSNNPSQQFTAVLLSGTSVYQVIYPRQMGYGDIDTIKVSYTDSCGNTGVTDGDYTKIDALVDRECRVYKNVINPGKGERTRVVYNTHEAGKVKIKVFSKKGTLVKELCNMTVDGSREQEEIIWDGCNSGGHEVASGTYIISIETSSYTEKAKVAVVR